MQPKDPAEYEADEILLTRQEAAAYLGVPTEVVDRLVTVRVLEEVEGGLHRFSDVSMVWHQFKAVWHPLEHPPEQPAGEAYEEAELLEKVDELRAALKDAYDVAVTTLADRLDDLIPTLQVEKNGSKAVAEAGKSGRRNRLQVAGN